ncbi:hypothetical protein ACFX10_003021 [Malus domestica]
MAHVVARVGLGLGTRWAQARSWLGLAYLGFGPVWAGVTRGTGLSLARLRPAGLGLLSWQLRLRLRPARIGPC